MYMKMVDKMKIEAAERKDQSN
jgi:hypothetical protein